MTRENIQMILNQSVSNHEELMVFNGLVNSSCSFLNITSDDGVYVEVEIIKSKMETFIEKLHTTTDPHRRNNILNNIASCRNQICTTLKSCILIKILLQVRVIIYELR